MPGPQDARRGNVSQVRLEDVSDPDDEYRTANEPTYRQTAHVYSTGMDPRISQFGLPQSNFPLSGEEQVGWQFPAGRLGYAMPSGQPSISMPSTYDASMAHRTSDSSGSTLCNTSNSAAISKSSFTLPKYPFDGEVPALGFTNTWPRQSWAPFPMEPSDYVDVEDDVETLAQEKSNLPRRRRGYLANLIDLYNHYGNSNDNEFVSKKRDSITRAANLKSRLVDPLAYNDDQLLDRDDPLVTGITKKCLDDMDEIDQSARRQLSYKERREEQQRVRIEFNLCSIEIRQRFLMTFARALLSFGSPSHRMESQLLAAARILEVDAEFTHMPGIIIASFGDEETKTSQMHFAKCPGRVSLGKMHRLHKIYRQVVHDELSAKRATEQLEEMLRSGPMYPLWMRAIFVFCIGGLICPLAFGGSFIDMWLGGASCLFLFGIQAGIATKKSVIYANVYEILSVIAVSFIARGLSTIRSQIFCYAAISSAGVVTVLPGYLILTSSLDLATKNIMCGSIKLVYALIYTLFLGFALQFGSDLFLLFDPAARHEIDTLAVRAAAAITITGSYTQDGNSTNARIPHMGSFTFTPSTPFKRQDIVKACYRPESFPWYLQPYPWWAQFIIVPIFSIISSFNNEQPITLDLFVMVLISCTSYAANKVADHFIFNRSDVVSAIGAFCVGLLGNIYSRKMRGTAFTVMVTGVLFLVPSGLSEAGGITAQDSATQIGSAMVSVTIGITVGLFVSHALVYLFGSNKNAAVFSF